MKVEKRASKKSSLVLRLLVALLIFGVLAAVTLFFLAKNVSYDSNANAQRLATNELYDQAVGVPGRLKELVDTQRPLDQSLQIVPYHMPAAYAAVMTKEGDAQWDVVLEARHISGGGLSAVDVTVITCVRYIMSARDFTVTMQPIECPRGPSRPGILQQKSFDTVIILESSRLSNS
jgi:hypothetical protein